MPLAIKRIPVDSPAMQAVVHQEIDALKSVIGVEHMVQLLDYSFSEDGGTCHITTRYQSVTCMSFSCVSFMSCYCCCISFMSCYCCCISFNSCCCCCCCCCCCISFVSCCAAVTLCRMLCLPVGTPFRLKAQSLAGKVMLVAHAGSSSKLKLAKLQRSCACVHSRSAIRQSGVCTYAGLRRVRALQRRSLI